MLPLALLASVNSARLALSEGCKALCSGCGPWALPWGTGSDPALARRKLEGECCTRLGAHKVLIGAMGQLLRVSTPHLGGSLSECQNDWQLVVCWVGRHPFRVLSWSCVNHSEVYSPARQESIYIWGVNYIILFWVLQPGPLGPAPQIALFGPSLGESIRPGLC